MANTRAWCEGRDSTRHKEASRLGSVAATGHADTWRTFTTCHVRADGSGFVQVKRDGVVIHTHHFDSEAVSDERHKALMARGRMDDLRNCKHDGELLLIDEAVREAFPANMRICKGCGMMLDAETRMLATLEEILQA